jgi:hypothetical protein
MQKTWRWRLAVDATALTLVACDRATRGEMLSKLEIDLLAHHVDAELVDWLKVRLNEIDSIDSRVWWDKLG